MTYTEPYYINLGYLYELGKASREEFERAYAEGPAAQRLLNQGACQAMAEVYE